MTREELELLIEKYLLGKATADEERLIDDFFDRQQKKRSPKEHELISEEIWASIHEKIERSGQSENKRQPVRFFRRSRMAAGLVVFVLLCIAGVAYFKDELAIDPPVALVTSACSKGQKSVITLSDGTRVYLNSASSITYPETFKNDSREIILSGEAFFEVTKDVRRPFTVRTANVFARVLGTSFNVEAFDRRDIKVTVVSGKVEVQANSDEQAIDAIILEPNEQGVYDGGSQLKHRSVDVEKFVSWKDNSLYFDDNTMEEVATELERWYNVTITFQNDNVRRCRINGQYNNMQLENVLKSVEYMYHIKHKYLNQNTIVLYGNGCN